MVKPDRIILSSFASNEKLGKYEFSSYKERVRDISQYSELMKIENWRNMLSNYYHSEFELDGKRWYSVEHYYQASKFRKITNKRSYKFFKSFSLDSKYDEYNRDVYRAVEVADAEEKGRNLLGDSNVKMVDDFYGGVINKASMRLALFAKFTQNEELERVLLATKYTHIYLIKTFKPELWHDLIIVRACIRFLRTKYDNLDEISKFSHEMINKVMRKSTQSSLVTNMARQTAKNRDIEGLIPRMPQDVITNIMGEYIGNPFVIVVKVKNRIRIPMIATNLGVRIDWGDGEEQELNITALNIEHKYKEPGQYIISMEGDIADMNFTKVKELMEVSQWGKAKINGIGTFVKCKNLIITATDAPDLSNATELVNTFNGCTVLEGDLSNWNVSNIKKMTGLFSDCKYFNGNLSKWNVSNVTDMKDMFRECQAFNGDLSRWNVSNATDMGFMFTGCHSFNSNLSRWNVSSVTDMRFMFVGCHSFNSDISEWNTTKVETMERMFEECKLFDSDLGSWNVSGVHRMDHMFSGCKMFNSDLSRWDVSEVDNMLYMFNDCVLFNQNLGNWNVSNVQDMVGMFRNCHSFRGWFLGKWDVSNVSDMSVMFDGCLMFDTDLNKWNVSRVNNMNGMFRGCALFNSDLSQWDVGNVTNMSNMFNGCTVFNSDLSQWDVSNVREMYAMFKNCKSFNSDLSDWNVQKLRVNLDMFDGCDSFTGDISGWDTRNLRDVERIEDYDSQESEYDEY